MIFWYILIVFFVIVGAAVIHIANRVGRIHDLMREDHKKSWGDLMRKTFGGESEIIVKPAREKKKGGFGPDDPPRL